MRLVDVFGLRSWLNIWLGVTCFEKSLNGILIHASEPQTGSGV